MPDDERLDRERLERDFLSEAEEIFDRAGERLRRLDGGTAAPHVAVDGLFRDVHSLKALASTLGLHEIADLAHDLEETLDRLRAHSAAPGPETLDLLHAGLATLAALARRLSRGGASPEGLDDLRLRLRAGRAAPPAGAADPLAEVPLDPGHRAALSEHEERRLAEAVRAGAGVMLVRVALEPERLDPDLRGIVAALTALGEVIATLPAFGAGAGDPVALTLLLAGGAEPSAVAGALAPHRPQVAILRGVAGLAAEPPPGRGGGQAATPDAGGAATAPAEAGGGGADAAGPDDLRDVSSSIRIPVGRLDDVLARVGDLSIAVASLARAAGALGERHHQDRALRDLGRQVLALVPRLRALQRSAIGARLVPLNQVFARVARMVARLTRGSGKEADLHTLGGETELDKGLMDELGAPLLHLLANALDHGIEPAAERAAAGKPRRGRLVLSAFQKGSQAVIDVIDDGRGIDHEAVRRAAESAGRIRPGEPLRTEDACEMIFLPGLSTARGVSRISGRGVGLDAVRQSIRRLKGRIEARSIPGRGTTFTITVPITLALVQALIVRAGGERYAIPLASVRENLRLEAARLRRVDGAEVYDHPRGPLPLLRLERLAGGAAPGGEGTTRYAVVSGPEARPFGMVVDAFVGQQEVVIKPVGRWLRDLPGLAGATELGDAAAVLVLEPESLVAGGSDDAGRA